jgi:hypothetical protein
MALCLSLGPNRSWQSASYAVRLTKSKGDQVMSAWSGSWSWFALSASKGKLPTRVILGSGWPLSVVECHLAPGLRRCFALEEDTFHKGEHVSRAGAFRSWSRTVKAVVRVVLADLGRPHWSWFTATCRPGRALCNLWHLWKHLGVYPVCVTQMPSHDA